MRPQIVIRYIGLCLLLNAALLSVSAVISAYKMDAAFFPLAYSAVVAVLLGVFPIIFVPPANDIRNEEGLAIVLFSWILSSMIGCLPYILYGGEFTFANAWFESVSGFTTTGSTILNNIEALPTGLLFWRSTTHFIGGIGIIIFMLAILPSIGHATMVLYKSEVSGLATDNFNYRTKKTLQIILMVYLGLNILETLILMLLGLSLFDAVTHAFGTIATGGFSTKNNSLAFFNSPAVEGVVIVFMILSGIHFGLIFAAVTGKIKQFFKSSFVRYYVLAMATGVALSAVQLKGAFYPDWLTALRYAAFQIISLGTSTGFATTDTAHWPPFTVMILIFFSLQCACAGSTSGGIKVDRVYIFWKAVIQQVKRLKHPKAIIALKVDGHTIAQDVVSTSVLYIIVYLVVVFLSALLLSFVGVDAISAFSGSVAAMGNVGPGFGSVSSMGNFSQIPDFGKWVLSFVMLVGRLEIYAFFVLFVFRFIP
jgi:trk system potassium uptake protein TrkH